VIDSMEVIEEEEKSLAGTIILEIPLLLLLEILLLLLLRLLLLLLLLLFDARPLRYSA